MSAVSQTLRKESSSEDKENLQLPKVSKNSKTELKEASEWHNIQGKLEEDQMEDDLMLAKRKMKKQSV